MNTNNGKRGGLLKGKPHYDKSGKAVGGIKAVVTDSGQQVELEGGEVIINKEASKKHWKELSRINQSAGNGVPILPPSSIDSDVEEYKDGGRITFNPNKLPPRTIYNYAKKIKENYPKVWDMGGNIFGNEAFKNLERVYKRGYWLESEEWMYIKWQSFNARHSGDIRIAGVIANLKWLNKVDKGWDYMKNLIEAEIDKKYGDDKMAKGGSINIENRNYRKNKTFYYVIWDNKKEVVRKDFESKEKAKSFYEKIIQTPTTFMATLDMDTFNEYGWLKEHRNLGRFPKFAKGGELAKGIKTEREHRKTIEDIYNRRITPKQAFKRIATDHLEEDANYYTKLHKMENKMAKGGYIGEPSTNSKTWDAQYEVGDYVQVRNDFNYPGAFFIKSITTEPSAKRPENPTGVVYKLNNGDAWEGKDLEPYNEQQGEEKKLEKSVPKVEKKSKTKINSQNLSDNWQNKKNVNAEFQDERKEITDFIKKEYNINQPLQIDYVVSDFVKSMEKKIEQITKNESVEKNISEQATKNIAIKEALKTIAEIDDTIPLIDKNEIGILHQLNEERQLQINVIDSEFDFNFESELGLYIQNLKASASEEISSKDLKKIAENPNFKLWFGSSQVVTDNGLPRVVYHGSSGLRYEFNEFKFSPFPAVYFAEKKSYAEWFQKIKGGNNVLFKCFLKVERPLDLTIFEVEPINYADLKTYVKLRYGYDLPNSALCENLKPQPIWHWLRFVPDFLKDLIQRNDYDGVHYYENNPQDILEDGQENITKAWLVFKGENIKSADYRNLTFSQLTKNITLEKGGKLC